MLFLDFMLLTMIIICVGYCYILTRRISDLQNSRIEFARIIKDLNTSISKAEHNISEMTELSKVTSKEIKSVVAQAEEISTQLVNISNFAAETEKELSDKINQARSFNIDESDYYKSIRSKAGERFTDADLPEAADSGTNENNNNYRGHIKEFIHKVISKKPEEAINMNQMGYYNTLRKINAKSK